MSPAASGSPSAMLARSSSWHRQRPCSYDPARRGESLLKELFRSTFIQSTIPKGINALCSSVNGRTKPMRNPADNTVQAAKPAGKTSSKRNTSGHMTAGSRRGFANWQTSSWSFSSMDTSPLAWWRTMPADLLGDAEHIFFAGYDRQSRCAQGSRVGIGQHRDRTGSAAN
jgi:hypothetical protein